MCTWRRSVEVVSRSIGGLLIVIALAATADSFVMSRIALAEFQRDNAGESRSRAASATGNAAVAVLKIGSVGIEVPVFSGTGRTALRRGAGTIEGTGSPGGEGNIGIAGHRDGFFRPLEDIRVGDRIELNSREGSQRFRVSEILIVDALDTSVLNSTHATRLTLVTCYPFYYVGFAPDRFIVHATLEASVSREHPNESHAAPVNSEAAENRPGESS